MKLDVIKLDGGKAGSIDLDEALFGLEPRADILHRVVRWQRARAQAGTHSTLGKSDVSYSTKKIYRQKGTGGARHGSKKAPIFRHGGVYKGPTPRSHAHDLPKKFRALGLRHALSAKAKAGELIIVDTLRAGAAGWRERATRMLDNTAQYFVSENPMLVTQAEAARFSWEENARQLTEFWQASIATGRNQT